MAVAVALVVVACGGGDEEEAAPTAAPTAAASPTPRATLTPAPTPTPAPKRGGTYRTSLPSEYRQLYPLKFNMGVDIVRLQPMMNGLIQWDPYKTGAKALLPNLAESWAVAGDGQTVTLKLRQGVKWHNGSPLTMKDILFSMDLMRTGHMKSQFAKVSGVDAPDEATLRITLSAVDPDFLVKLAQPHVMITPSGLTEEQFRNQPIGTGPFKWASYQRGVGGEYARNPDYFKPGLPYLDSLSILIILDLALQRSAFQTGRLERSDNSQFAIADDGILEDVKRAVPGVQSHKFMAGIQWVIFNKVAPWTDPRVRRAFHLSIDRTKMVQGYFRGLGYEWAGVWTAPALGGATGLAEDEVKKLPGYRQPKDQDWAEAKRLLQEAGIDGSKLEISFITRRPYDEAPAFIAQDLARGGFTGKFNFRAFDAAALTTELQKKNFEVAYGGYGHLVDLPESYIPDHFLPGGLNNYVGWENPEIIRLYNQQATLLDPVARKRVVDQIYRLSIDDATVPTSVNLLRIVVIQSYVRNSPVGLSGFFDEWSRFEQEWLDR